MVAFGISSGQQDVSLQVVVATRQYLSSTLTPRAEEARTVHERLAPDRCAAAVAFLPLPAVGVQITGKVATLAVNVHVQRIERRTAHAQRIGHNLMDAVEQCSQRSWA